MQRDYGVPNRPNVLRAFRPVRPRKLRAGSPPRYYGYHDSVCQNLLPFVQEMRHIEVSPINETLLINFGKKAFYYYKWTYMLLKLKESTPCFFQIVKKLQGF